MSREEKLEALRSYYSSFDGLDELAANIKREGEYWIDEAYYDLFEITKEEEEYRESLRVGTLY